MKLKMLQVEEDVRDLVKRRAYRKNMTIKNYVRKLVEDDKKKDDKKDK